MYNLSNEKGNENENEKKNYLLLFLMSLNVLSLSSNPESKFLKVNLLGVRRTSPWRVRRGGERLREDEETEVREAGEVGVEAGREVEGEVG